MGLAALFKGLTRGYICAVVSISAGVWARGVVIIPHGTCLTEREPNSMTVTRGHMTCVRYELERTWDIQLCEQLFFGLFWRIQYDYNYCSLKEGNEDEHLSAVGQERYY
jgi:hypothetical protein